MRAAGVGAGPCRGAPSPRPPPAATGRPRGVAAAGRALGTALAGVLNLLDVDIVVLGGGYARLAPWLAPAVTAQLRARVLAVGAREVTVLPGRLGAEAAVLGAAGSVVRGVLADPAAHLASVDAAR